MSARHAVLLTPSKSSAPSQLPSCKHPAHESPQIPFFVFKRLRTLSFSVSSKSFPCHSYENSRVCTNNSQSGTEHPIRMRVLSDASEPKDLSPSVASCATPATHHYTQVLSFQILAHSFALSCTLRKLNPLIFKRFRTLCKKTPGGGVVLVSPANYRLSTMNLQPHLTYSQEALSLSHSPVPNGGCGMPRHLRAVFVALCLVLLVSGCKKETTDESASNPPPDNTAATGAAPDAGKKAGGVLSAFSSTITVPEGTPIDVVLDQ